MSYEIEAHKQKLELARFTHESLRDQIVQVDEYAVRMGEGAIKASLLINGGALVALLAFLGNLAKFDADLRNLNNLRFPMILFAAGVLSSTVGLGLSWAANFCSARALINYRMDFEFPFIHKQPKAVYYDRATSALQVLAIIFGVAPLICFAIGAWLASDALITLLSHPHLH